MTSQANVSLSRPPCRIEQTAPQAQEVTVVEPAATPSQWIGGYAKIESFGTVLSYDHMTVIDGEAEGLSQVSHQ